MATGRRLGFATGMSMSLCLLFAIVPNLFADSHARIVRLSDTEGKVQIDRNTGQGFERAIPNMPITQGTRLQTGDSGRAEVEFENGSVVRLADNSSVEFNDLSLRSDGQRVNELRVDDGTLYVNYRHKDGGDFRLVLGSESIDLNRDAHFRLQFDHGQVNIAVFKGEVEVPTSGKVAKVKKDETFTLDLNDSSHDLLAKGISNFDADQWDSERTAYNTQYASTFNRSRYPYEYGYSDLMYYGSFFNAPGYGMLWRPFGVSTLWDPFGAGAWAYYPSYGYMWVSGYPWGWTPYRYGTWLYVPSYGWAWQPGGWNTWNAYPAVMNAPPSWRHPVPPSMTATRSTVIVGNPTFTRPTRPVMNAAGQPMLGGTARTNAAATVNRPSRTITPGTTATPSASTASTTSARPSRTQTSTAGRSQSTAINRSSREMRPMPPPAATPPPAPRSAPAPRPSAPRASSMPPMSMPSGGMSMPRPSMGASRPVRH